MLLYKFVSNHEIATQVSLGVFRFYELTKYIKSETDAIGRADAGEGSVSFPNEGTPSFVAKLPTASFNGVEFQCQSIQPSEDHLQQYFVFCMSAAKSERAVGDAKFAVELNTDCFEMFDQSLHEFYGFTPDKGERIFSHGAIEYYDIDNHPRPFGDERWREVYAKHAQFAYQQEYRAALFVSDVFFDRTSKTPMVVRRKIFGEDGTPLPYDLMFSLRSGVDFVGWRYVEIDASEFQANLIGKPSMIMSI